MLPPDKGAWTTTLSEHRTKFIAHPAVRYNRRTLPTKKPSQQLCLTIEYSQQPPWSQSPAYSPTQLQSIVCILSRFKSTTWGLIQLWITACGPIWTYIPASSIIDLGSTAWDNTQPGVIEEPSSEPCPIAESNQWHHLAKECSMWPCQPEVITESSLECYFT